ncbi:MAG: dATP pyrophosphohydrolase [Geminicoccaceae bacterium]
MSSRHATVAIQTVHDRADLKAFFDVTRHVYRDDPNWVQPLTLERLDHLNPKKNPFLDGIEAAYWIVHLDGKPAGRISAQVNRAHLERHHDATGHFGFLEAVDDEEAFGLLIETAETWLRMRHMERMQGPFSLSINDETGTLVEGFDTPPSMMMPHGRPYYDARLAEQGLAKAKDLIAFRFDNSVPMPPAARRLIERTARTGSLVVRQLDMHRYVEEIRLICDIFNDGWAENWGFIPFGDAEAQYMAKSIRPLVDAGFFAIAELDGEPAAMTVTLPNLNEAIEGLDGRLLPFGWAKLLWRLKVSGVKTGRMPLMGLRRKWHGTLKGTAAALGVIDAVKQYHAARGVREGELSWVLEDNVAVQRIIDAVGAVPYKRYRVYEKAL